MCKNIVVEIVDGIIQAVYCDDATFTVDVLDWDDRKHCDESTENYYSELEKEIENKINCY